MKFVCSLRFEFQTYRGFLDLSQFLWHALSVAILKYHVNREKITILKNIFQIKKNMWFLGNSQIWQNKKRDRYNFLSLTTATTRRFRGNKHHYCNDDVKNRKGRRRSWHFGKFPDVIFSNIPTNKTINQSVVKTQSTLEILNYNMCISHLPIYENRYWYL